MKDNKTKLLALFLTILTIIVLIASFALKKTKKMEPDILIVKNPSNFFTVNSCLYRTITYASQKDVDSLLKVLSKDYKEDNKVNDNNVLNLFPNIEGEVTFVSKKMYYQEINDDITRYYVKGYIEKNTIHDYTIVEKQNNDDLYFVVNLNSKKQIFSVEPYNGEIFMDGEKNE